MKFQLGASVRKTKGSQWHGTVVGTYSTTLTPEGYAVESATESGSVQIYPASALEPWEGDSTRTLLLEAIGMLATLPIKHPQQGEDRGALIRRVGELIK
jgi:hypothetical protein